MPVAFAFDIFGTLLDRRAIVPELKSLVGEKAEQFAERWQEKRLEYAWIRTLIRRYEDFSRCTDQALRQIERQFGRAFSDEERGRLLRRMGNLPAFSDVIPGLRNLKALGHTLVAFSNATRSSARTALEQAAILKSVADVISVDEVMSFKPDRAAYAYLVSRMEREPTDIWLVSENSWDVTGAKAAGLRAVWVRRQPQIEFESMGLEPDFVVSDMLDLAERFAMDEDVAGVGLREPIAANNRKILETES